jgi:hypothetical protein
MALLRMQGWHRIWPQQAALATLWPPAPSLSPQPRCNISRPRRCIVLNPTMRIYIGTFLGTFLFALLVGLKALGLLTGPARPSVSPEQERVDA